MKKLFSLLSLLTISVTAVPNLISASPYQNQKQEELNRDKRGVNHGNEIEASWDDFWVSFKPELWEAIIIKYNSTSDINIFKNWFKDRMNNGVWQDTRVKQHDLKGIAVNIWTNWGYYNSLWENSPKNKRIRIKIARTKNYDFRMTDTGIRYGDSQIYENYYEDQRKQQKWNNDFNSKTDLGIIDNDKNETIWNAIKKQNPNLDISQFNIANKTNFSFLK